MKTTSRKRLLISSVAMLLVAMLALGTATFAWFTSSTTATANNINVKTIKASELQISSKNVDWGTKVDYQTKNKILLPASTVDGKNWFTANAETKTNFKKADDVDFAVATPANYYYFTEQLNVRNNGAADVEKVKIDITFPDSGAKYARVGVQEVAEKGGTTTKGDFQIFDISGVAYDGVATANTTSAITPDNKCTVTVGTLKGKDSIGGGAATGEAKYYLIYVWFEGQDVDCIDSESGAELPDVTFTVSGDTVSQIGD